MEPEDVIRRINRSTVDCVEGLQQAVTEGHSSGPAVVFVQRGNGVYRITVEQ